MFESMTSLTGGGGLANTASAGGNDKIGNTDFSKLSFNAKPDYLMPAAILGGAWLLGQLMKGRK